MANSEKVPAVQAQATKETVRPAPQYPVPAQASRPALPLTHPLGETPGNILALQHAFGNRHVTKLMAARHPSLQRQASHTTAACPAKPHEPPVYDIKPMPLLQLPEGGPDRNKAEDMRKDLDKRIAACEITAYKTIGGRTAGNEYFLLRAISAILREGRSWNREINGETEIDWPQKGSNQFQKGLITVRIDSQGAASAELGVLPQVRHVSSKDGLAELKAKFRSVTWPTSPDKEAEAATEISAVLGALALLPNDTALREVDLIRAPSLPAHTSVKNQGGTDAGLFDPQTGSLYLSDRVFYEFVKSGARVGPATTLDIFRLVLHEVGHVMETQDYRQAHKDHDQAVADESNAKTAMEAAGKLAKDPANAKNTKVKEDAKTAQENHTVAEEHEGDRKLDLNLTSTDQYDIASNKPTSAKESDATKARKEAADSLSGVQSLKKGASKSVVQAMEDASTAIDAFAQAAKTGSQSVSDLEKPAFEKVRILDKLALQTKLAKLTMAASYQDDWFAAERVLAWANHSTLQKFIEAVRQNPDFRRFTVYASDNWMHNPEEAYADAYSLCLVHPGFMRTNYKDVYDFFQHP
jgi:hypothetical protein